MQIRKFKAKKGGKVIEYQVAIPESFAEVAATMEEHETYRYWLVGYLEMQKRVALGTMPKMKKFIKIPVEGLSQVQIGVLAQLGLLQTLPGEAVQIGFAAHHAASVPSQPPVESLPEAPASLEVENSGPPEEALEIPQAESAPEKSDEEWGEELGIPQVG